jgi:conjugal transfer pilus assembly protein TraF
MCGPTISALTSLQNQFGFTVMPVSLDGHSLPGNPFQVVQYDSGLAAHLGVIASPALALVAPPHGAEIVSHSAVSMDVATQRILAAAHRIDLITEQERRATERMNNIGLIDNSSLADAPDDITENPTDFINRMREEAKKAFYQHGADQ